MHFLYIWFVFETKITSNWVSRFDQPACVDAACLSSRFWLPWLNMWLSNFLRWIVCGLSTLQLLAVSLCVGRSKQTQIQSSFSYTYFLHYFHNVASSPSLAQCCLFVSFSPFALIRCSCKNLFTIPSIKRVDRWVAGRESLLSHCG